MARPSVLSPVSLIAAAFALMPCAPLAVAGPPSSRPTISQAAKIRARNYTRPGWFLVDGNWARSQASLTLGDLVTLVEENGQFQLWSDPSQRFDPMLKNARTTLVEIKGSEFPWKLSAAGRMWNDTRSAGSQHLQLIAAMDEARADNQYRLTKIEIRPDQQVIQAVIIDGEKLTSVIVVLGRDFIECTVGPFDAPPADLFRSSGARQMLLDRPIETRQYVVPLLRLVNNGINPLMPAAADVYRTFPDLPLDDLATQTIRALVPDLSARDPAVRRRASAELRSLGRRGVQAAMHFDPKGVPIEAAERIASLAAADSRDARPAEQLQKDSGFILDCLSDPDANVRAEAAKWIGKQ